MRRKRARPPPPPGPVTQPWLAEALGTAAWTGTPLAPLLAEAGPLDGAVEVVFTGLDRGVEGGEEQDYARSLTLDEAPRDDVLLAYGMNGGPLLPQHGFPLRLVVPGWYGMASVKWLNRITVVDRPFEGHQQADAYRFRRDEDDPGTPLTRIFPRALMIPPGLAGFPERERTLAAGRDHDRGPRLVGLGGDRAGRARRRRRVARCRARPAGGTLGLARLARRVGRDARRARPLPAAPTTPTATRSPTSADWNVGGYANNGVQLVPVTVT